MVKNKISRIFETDIIKKFISFILAVILLNYSMDSSDFISRIPSRAEENYSNTIAGFKVETFWKNSADESNYIWNAEEPEQAAPRFVLMYSNPSLNRPIRAGDIEFTVPCFGDVIRGYTPDDKYKPAYSVDTDWNGVYHSENDTYTYTYKGAEQSEGSLSGGFELVWNLNSRECVNGFDESRSVTVKILRRDSEGRLLNENNEVVDDENAACRDTIELPPLNLSFTSVRDNYVVDVAEDEIAFIKKDNYYENDPNYIWYNIENTIKRTDINSRGLEMSTYYIEITPENIPEGTDLSTVYIKYGNSHYPLKSLENDGTTYRFYPEGYTNMTGDFDYKQLTINLGVPENLGEAKFNITGHLSRLYKDDTEWEDSPIDNQAETVDKTDDTSVLIFNPGKKEEYANSVVPTKGSGDNIGIEHNKSNPYNENNKLNALEVINGKIIDFKLKSKTTSNVNNSYSLIIQDDNLQVSGKDGNYRDIYKSEYDFVSITMPEYIKYNDVTSNDSGQFYNYIISGDNKPLFNGNTEQESTFFFNDNYDSVKIEIEGIQGGIDYSPVLRIRFHLNDDFLQTGEIVNDSHSNILFENQTYNQIYSESKVYLREPQVVITSSTAFQKINNEFSDNGFAEDTTNHVFKSNVTTGGTISSDIDTNLTEFSLYTIIPSVLNPDIYNENITVEGSYFRASDGQQLSDFNGRVEFSTRQYGNNTLIIADFHFEDMPVMTGSGKTVNLSINYPVSLAYSEYIQAINNNYVVESYTMLHDGVQNLIANNKEPQDIDLNNNGIPYEKAAKSYDSRAVIKNAESWQQYAPKYVRSAYSNGWEKETHVKISEDEDDDNDTNKKLTLYSYRLDLQMGNYNAKELVFYDNLEQYNDTSDQNKGTSEWQGKFQGIDISSSGSNFNELKLNADIYYSTKADAEHDITNSTWEKYDENTDKSSVKSIAVVVTPETEGEWIYYSTYLYFTVNMEAPSEIACINKTAINDFDVRYTGYDKDPSQQISKEEIVESGVAKVKLTKQTINLTIHKTDYGNLLKESTEGNHYSPITGAEFTFTPEDSSQSPFTYKVNSRGVLKIDDLQYGTYTVEETETPQGYQTMNPFKIIVGKADNEEENPFNVRLQGESTPVKAAGGIRLGSITDTQEGVKVYNYELEIPDERIPGKVKLHKTCNNYIQGITPVAGAEYELYTSDGVLVRTNENNEYSETGTKSLFTTDSDGYIQITNLPWGSYYFLEKNAPEGYQLNTNKCNFTIQYDNAGTDIIVETTDDEKSTKVILVKQDEEDNRNLKGAMFQIEIYKNGVWTPSFTYTTGTGGQFIIEAQLCFGTYRFVEITAPEGYELPTDDKKYFPDENGFTLGPDSESGNVNISVTITAKNKRNPAKVQLQKDSEDGYLYDAEYNLYKVKGKPDNIDFSNTIPVMKPDDGDEADEMIDSRLKTNVGMGKTKPIPNLEWGDYYFLEVVAPKGYELKKERIDFRLGADNTEIAKIVEVYDERAKGSVELKKVSETDNTPLQEAEFNLYKNDGTLINQKAPLVTDENGIIKVDNLEWGSYYFQEIKAPEGYGLHPDKIRFSVMKENCQSIQKIVCKDPPQTAQLTIQKEIDDRIDEYGNPTFLFKVEKLKDDNSVEASWTKMITITSGLEDSVILSGLYAGKYRISELPVSRYSLQKAEAVSPSSDMDTDNKTVTIQLEKNGKGIVKFTNQLTRYDKYSHCSSAVNIVAKGRTLTSISAELKNSLLTPTSSNAYNFTDNDFEVYAIYDDGSKQKLTLGQKPDEGSNPDYSECKYQIDKWSVAGSEVVQYVTINVSYEENGISVENKVILEIAPLSIPKPFTVTFHSNGGYFEENVHVKQVKFTYDEDTETMQPESDINFIPQHLDTLKSFSGWYYDEACSDDQIVDLSDFYDSTKEHENIITIYAKWIEGNAQLLGGRGKWEANNPYSYFLEKLIALSGGMENITAIKQSLFVPDYITVDELENISQLKIPADITEKDKILNYFQSDTNTGVKTFPIFAWYRNGTIYWWSKDMTPQMAKISDRLFDGCINIQDISGVRNWDSSQVENMEGMFCSVCGITSVDDLQNWDTSKVTKMKGMFWNNQSSQSQLTNLNGLKNWDTSKVINMEQMFFNCESLNNISGVFNWDTSQVKSTKQMFDSDEKHRMDNLTSIDGLNWDISSLTDASYMFERTGITSISNVTFTDNSQPGNKDLKAVGMFKYCDYLTSITGLNFDTQNVTEMTSMFLVGNTTAGRMNNISGLKPNGDKIWNVSRVTNMNTMFQNQDDITSFNDIKDWHVENVTVSGFYFFARYNPNAQSTSSFSFTYRPGSFNNNGTYVPK